MFKELAAIILAAGRGGRLGRPKLSLRLGGVEFWRLISKRLKKAGIRDIAVVVRRSKRRLLADEGQVKAVVNRRPYLGMFSSIQCGLRAKRGFSGYLLCPVDHPGVEVQTYLKLAKAFLRSPDSIIRPSYRGAPGHPIIIPGTMALKLCKLRPEERLDYLIKQSGLKIIDIKVKDSYTIININTNRDLEVARKHNRSYPGRHQG